jgi:hypothetical protein
MSRRGKPPDWPKRIEPLHLAMLRAAGRTPSLEQLESLGAAAVTAAAVAADSLPEVRLEAAERAAAWNVLKPSDLAEAYAEASFGAADRADPVTRAKELGGARGVALLAQATALQPANAPTYLAAALRLARDSNHLHSVGAALLPSLRLLAVEPAALAVAADAVRLLALADDPVLARRWHALLPPGEAEAMRLLPVLALAANATGDLDGEQLARWWRGQSNASEERKSATLARLLACWRGLGHAPPAGAATLVLDLADTTENHVAPLGLRQALLAASEQQRLGETLALALIVLGEGGPGGASPTNLQAALDGLRAAGLAAEARRLAVEALVADSF